MNLAFVLCVALGLVFLALTSMALIAVWVYRDAKSRGLEAGVWTLVVVLVPSLLGLLLYFLVGRKESRRPCSGCGKPVPVRSTFCGYCGAQLPQEDPQPVKPVGKGLLIAAVIGIVLTVVLGIAAVVGLAIADGVDFTPSISTVYVENNRGDQWSVKWHYTNKSPRCSFKIEDNGKPNMLYFEGECEEGPLTLRVYQGELERTFDLSGGGEIEESLDLSIFSPGKVYLELDNSRGEGKNVEFEAHWKS